MDTKGYQQYKQQSINSMTPGELLMLLYDELVKRSTLASLALDKADWPRFEAALDRCIDIVNYLDETLDRQYMLGDFLLVAPVFKESGEAEYYLRQYAWEWLAAIPAALPVKIWLGRPLERRRETGSRAAAAVMAFGPKFMALCLLGLSAVRLLSSTFRSFLYFQF